MDTLTESPPEFDSPTDEQYLDAPEAVATVNRCLLEVGESPLPAATKDTKQIEHKMDRLTEAMKELILADSADINPQKSDESKIIMQLKERFRATMKKSEQLQILTVLPQSWTRK